MSAADEMRNVNLQLQRMTQSVFAAVCIEAQRSIVEGSELSGAPGQPVDTGALRASWILELESATRATISTNLVYAEPVEHGIGSKGQPVAYGASGVGGSHSVALTIGAMPHIVAVCAERRQGFVNGVNGWAGEDGG